MRSNSPRKNSCIDWRWSAASAASSSRTSSGTFLIVICTGMTALCQHQTTTPIPPPLPPENHLPLTTPAPPPVVLADAGTHPHPPHRARPREDGDDNPSFVPAPFRYSRAPSRCPRGCGDPSPSPAQSLPPGDDNPSFVKTGTTIHLSSQLPSDPPAPPPVVLADAGTHPHPREEPTPMKTRAGIHHPTLTSPFR